MAAFVKITVIFIAAFLFENGFGSNCTEVLAKSHHGICPTWFFLTINGCQCAGTYHSEDAIKCNAYSNYVNLSQEYCVTYNETSKLTFMGKCPYNTLPYHNSKNFQSDSFFYHSITDDVLQINEQMCGPLNRTGLLCSQCQPGLGPAVFSYKRECLECVKQPYGWVIYFVRVTIPLTLFCVVVIFFQINATSPVLNGFVVFAQIVTNMSNSNPYIMLESNWENIQFTSSFIVSCYGFFNLDILQLVIPSFCISEGMSMLTVLALEYTVALYPIIFTIVVYYCITLHDNGCKILVCCWKPFHRCFARFRSSWKLKGSVINAFVTFLLLSYCKFCSISISLLRRTKVFDVCSTPQDEVYHDASIENFSKQHMPYAILALTITIVFIILPALFVLFYQNRFFQKFLSCCKIRCVLIHELANTTQGCFKNGTTPGTRDYRWFAGLYLLLRIGYIALLGNFDRDIWFSLTPCIVSYIVATLRPYRVDHYNSLDSGLWLLLGLSNSSYTFSHLHRRFTTAVSHTLLSIPLVYIIGYVTWKVASSIVKKVRTWQYHNKRVRRLTSESEQNNIQRSNEAHSPSRLAGPNESTPLIPTSSDIVCR